MEKLIGAAILLASTTIYSLMTPLFKKANSDIPPFTVMAISMFSLFVLSFIASMVFENGRNFNFLTNRSNVSLLLFVGFLNFVGFWLFILGFKYLAVWQQEMFRVLIPILAGVFAYFILKEPISFKLFFGLVLAGLGIYIALK